MGSVTYNGATYGRYSRFETAFKANGGTCNYTILINTIMSDIG